MKRAACLLALLLLLPSGLALAAPPERWLHVRVEETGPNAENVRVNLPLSLAEKILPMIKAEKLEHGKIKIEEINLQGVDVRALLAALRDLDDHEFVTIESARENVRVAKAGGHLLVKVRETHAHDEGQFTETVDVEIPMVVLDAMLAGSPDELDLAAGVRALAGLGDTVLVTVRERNSTVRVWVDSISTTD